MKYEDNVIELVTEAILDDRETKWMIAHPDGKEWPTIGRYTRAQVEKFMGHPARRIDD